MNDDTLTGGCYCGAVTFTLRLPVLETYHCHCSICRRLHGAAFVTWVKAPHAHFAVGTGSDRLQVLPLTHEQRSFCAACGSTVCSEVIAESPRRDVWVPRAALPDAAPLTPAFHKYVASAAGWMAIADDLPRFSGNGTLIAPE